jgi:hypothetical protein
MLIKRFIYVFEVLILKFIIFTCLLRLQDENDSTPRWVAPAGGYRVDVNRQTLPDSLHSAEEIDGEGGGDEDAGLLARVLARDADSSNTPAGSLEYMLEEDRGNDDKLARLVELHPRRGTLRLRANASRLLPEDQGISIG